MRPARPLRPAGPLALAVLAALSALLLPRASAAAKPGAGFTERVCAPFTGDFDAMAARGMIRILVIPSQTSYFVDKGTQRGLAYEGGQAFEAKLDKERRKGTPRIDVVFVPVHRDELLEALVQGRGDLAAANLTITPERQELVDFSAPVATGVREIVVTGPNSPDVKSLKYVKDAGATRERRKLLELIEIFRKYSDQYGFDWLMLAAQGYQESRLDQNVKSRVGAIGIMQVMPATGRELGVGDIRQPGPNIHAGTSYLRQMIDRNFSDPAIDPMNRTLFAFAGYNAGPARVAGLRRKARKQ